MVRLTLLGAFEARRASGESITLAKAKARALLAYLASHQGQAFARDKLAALLWLDFPEEQARHNLRQSLFTLRKHVPSLSLVVDGDTVAVPADLVSVDVHDFQRSIARATPDALAEAATLYRGELLEGLRVSSAPFDDWLLGERERLRALAVSGLGKLLAHERDTGRTADAMCTAMRLVTADPLQEATHRALMELYAGSGQRARALHQYQVCAQVLLRELGVRPEPETERVYREILQPGPALHPPEIRRPGAGLDDAAGDLAHPETPLVGRDAELAALGRARERAWNGSGHVVTILGEAGVGKTRLAEEVAADARRRGAGVLLGRSYEMEQLLPFGPWLDALRPAVAMERQALGELAPAWQRELTRLFPEMAGAEPTPAADDNAPGQLFEAVAHLVGWLSRDRPLVVIVEDLHWADDMSLRLLSFMAHRIHDQRTLLLITSREEEVAEIPGLRRLLSALDREPRHVRLALGPLSRDATAALARSLARFPRDLAALAELERHAWEASDGNPFVAIETVRELQIDPSSGSGITSLPARVSEMIAARLDRLDERAGTLVAVAAVIGRELEPALLQRATGLDAEDVASGVETLVHRHILAVRGDRLDFVHDRIRTVAASRLLPPRRTLVHGRVAQAIAEVHAGDLAAHAGRLALHYREGHVWEEARGYLRLAGRQAAARAANREAAIYFEQAIEALAHLAESRERIEQAIDLRLDLRGALQPLGESDRLLERLAEAKRLATDLGDSRRLGWTLAFMSHALWETGQLAAAQAHGQSALDIAEVLADRALAAEADRRLAQASFSSGDYGQASDRLTAMVRLGELDRQAGRLGLPDIDPDEWARPWLAWALGEQGKFDDGIAAGHEAIRLARTRDHPQRGATGLLCLAELYCIKGELSLAIELLERAQERVRHHHLQGLVFPVTRTLGYSYALAGRLPEGLTLLRQAMAIAESLGYRRPLATRCLEQIGRACLLDGRLDEALEMAGRAHARACSRGERGLQAYALRLLGDIAARPERPDVDTAAARYREAIALTAALGMQPLAARCHHALGELYRGTGRARSGRDHSALARKMGAELGLRDLGA